ncbi:MAG: hypothetical protein HYW85_07430 [Deltaproteobacteria bacterium]|nr:hypothetical protein [Deltaproteobacteria bacterium]MBI3018207.1 hypothetical protein [Deltaproteobacteria bacterium]
MLKTILGFLLIVGITMPLFALDTTEKIQNRIEKQEGISQKRLEKKRALLEKKYKKRLKKLERWHEKELKQIAYEEKIMKEKLDAKKEKLEQP